MLHSNYFLHMYSLYVDPVQLLIKTYIISGIIFHYLAAPNGFHICVI